MILAESLIFGLTQATLYLMAQRFTQLQFELYMACIGADNEVTFQDVLTGEMIVFEKHPSPASVPPQEPAGERAQPASENEEPEINLRGSEDDVLSSMQD